MHLVHYLPVKNYPIKYTRTKVTQDIDKFKNESQLRQSTTKLILHTTSLYSIFRYSTSIHSNRSPILNYYFNKTKFV